MNDAPALDLVPDGGSSPAPAAEGTAPFAPSAAGGHPAPPLLEPHHTEMVPAFAAISPLTQEAAAQPADALPLPDHLRQIPFQLELRVLLSRFTLRDLQQLKVGDLLLTEHLSVRDLVLTAAGERLLLVELEAIEQQLAARVKRLAWRHKWRRQA
jgi:flagellar motor switch protein FliM